MFTRLTETLQEIQQCTGDDAGYALNQLLDCAATLVPGAQYAGITRVSSRGRVETIAATHHYVSSLDDIARRHRQGPCLSVLWHDGVVRVDDLAAERRWPLYAARAPEVTPVRSALALRLPTDGVHSAALSFYAERTHAFDDESVELGTAVAAQTALAWTLVRRDAEFRTALASRDIIGQAKGMLMERYDIDAVRAFGLLKRLSQTSNIPVADVARRLVNADHPLP